MNTHSVKPENLVLEINGIQEKEINPLKDAFEVWKNTGIRLTIDRFGIGYTTLQDVFELKPDFLKLDQKFVRGLRKSRFKKVALESLIHFSHKNGFELIVDGVRDLPTLFILMQMGVAYAQGDGISKPSSLAGNLGNWFDDIGE
jgi:EAL domain.